MPEKRRVDRGHGREGITKRVKLPRLLAGICRDDRVLRIVEFTDPREPFVRWFNRLALRSGEYAVPVTQIPLPPLPPGRAA